MNSLFSLRFPSFASALLPDRLIAKAIAHALSAAR
jgi:hypothetical protein